jgi:nucleoside-diphosphate-sugar epimerase
MDPEDGRVISNIICQVLRGEPITIYGDGSQTRSFQYIDDLIEGIWRLMQVNYDQPVNLGNPDEYTILQLAQIVQEEAGLGSPIVHRPLPQDDPRQRKPDIDRARSILGWEPKVPVRNGIRKSIEYFRSELGSHAASVTASTLAAG